MIPSSYMSDDPLTPELWREDISQEVLYNHGGSINKSAPISTPFADTTIMEVKLQLPTDVTERRRLQNRIAQRRFRERREQRQAASNNASNNTSNNASNNTSNNTSPRSKPSSTVQSPVLQFDSPNFDQNDITYITSPDFNENDFWHLQIKESLLNGTDLPEPGSISESLFDLNSSLATIKASTDPFHAYNSEMQTSDSTTEPYQLMPASAMNGGLSPSQYTNLPPCNSNIWLSSLHIAAQKGHDRIVRVLIQQNMDCNEKDSEGRTPLMHAVIENHESVVTALISHGACINQLDNLQRSVLHLAVLYRRENMLKAFLGSCYERRQELDINAYDASGKTPLHIAVEEGFEMGVVLLLQNGANINVKARKSMEL